VQALFLAALAALPGLLPFQNTAEKPDTGRIAKELAGIVAARELVAKPITEILKGWVVGNDPPPGTGSECWDEPGRGLRVALTTAVDSDTKTSIDVAASAPIPIAGLERVGEPIRASAPGCDDVIFFLRLAREGIHAAHWMRAVRLGEGIDPPILMARFRSAGGATFEDFRKALVFDLDGVRPAFDTYLAVALRRRSAWPRGESRLSLDLGNGETLTIDAPARSKRIEAPDLVAGWESAAGTLRVTADTLRHAGLEAAGAERRAILERAGERVLGDPRVEKGVFEMSTAARDGASERWRLVQLRLAGPILFRLEAEGVVPGPAKKPLVRVPDGARRAFDPALRSFNVARK